MKVFKVIKIAKKKKKLFDSEAIKFFGMLYGIFIIIGIIVNYPWFSFAIIFILIAIHLMSKPYRKTKNQSAWGKGDDFENFVAKQDTYKHSDLKYNQNKPYRKTKNQFALGKGDDFENFVVKQDTYKHSDSKYNQNKPYRKTKNQSAWGKGDDFENFVAKQFHNNSNYTVVNWNGDKMRKYNVYVESDSGPDLKIRHEPTKEEFYIECKYRSKLYKGKYKWTNAEQRKRYLEFDSNNMDQFYVVLGLGGSPSNPNDVYCVPLREAKYVGLYPFVLEKYYHNPKVDLVWKNGILR